MKLEQQVVSLELSQKLKELGVRQESLLGWYNSPLLQDGKYIYWGELGECSNDAPGHAMICAAFTVSELGEMLPDQVSVWRNGLECICSHDELTEMGTVVQTQYADTEADARAKMLIYLLESNLLSLLQDKSA